MSLSGSHLPRWILLQAGGSFQQARALLSLAASNVAGSSCISTSSTGSGASSNLGIGRSICTTRGIYMGRVFVRENLQRQPQQNPLFNRDNYQYLERNGWSQSACEQVLHNHQDSRPARGAGLVHRQLAANIETTSSLAQLQALVVRHAHQMDAANCAAAVKRSAWLLMRPDGQPDYESAALVLNTIAAHLQPQLADLSGPALCQVLASFVKCKCSPPADMLQELLQSLMADGSLKLQQTNAPSLARLLLALSRLVQPQGHWPIMKAVLQHATVLLQEQLGELNHQKQQQHIQQLDGPDGAAASSSSSDLSAESGVSSSSSSSSNRDDRDSKHLRGKRGSAGRQMSRQQATTVNEDRDRAAVINSTALLAILLDKANTFSPEYLRLLFQWLENTDNALGCLYPNSAVQLWAALKGQWAKFEARTSSNAGSAAAAAAAAAAAERVPPGDSSGESGSSTASAADADAASGSTAAEGSAAGSQTAGSVTNAGLGRGEGSLEEYQQKLYGFFGQEPLMQLAAATAPLVGSMTENHLGQLFNHVGRMRFCTPDLLSAMTVAYKALSAVKTPTYATKANAAWAAAQLQQFDPALLLPALLAAVQHPEQQDGFLAARIMIATSQLPQDVLQQMQLLLRQEQHRLSGARGPPPAAVPTAAAVDPATAATAQVPDWVTSLADSLAGRVAELRPREIAYILLSYSRIPGIPVHEKLFTAATEHIVLHAHTFTQLDDMEMVATAFEKFNFKAGLPALKALQQQSEQLVPPPAS